MTVAHGKPTLVTCMLVHFLVLPCPFCFAIQYLLHTRFFGPNDIVVPSHLIYGAVVKDMLWQQRLAVFARNLISSVFTPADFHVRLFMGIFPGSRAAV